MRDLFSDPLPMQGVPPPPKDDRSSERYAKEFVRWCCSFGADFRNSPDITNLRFWMQKRRFKLKEKEEREILDAARPAFAKQIEILMRTTEVTN